MREKRYTEGPWFVVNDTIYRRPKSDLYEYGGGVAGDKPLALIRQGWYGEEYDEADVYPVKANANLISSAPELLEALEELLFLCELEPMEDSATEIKRAKAAIAKAYGGPND